MNAHSVSFERCVRWTLQRLSETPFSSCLSGRAKSSRLTNHYYFNSSPKIPLRITRTYSGKVFMKWEDLGDQKELSCDGNDPVFVCVLLTINGADEGV